MEEKMGESGKIDEVDALLDLSIRRSIYSSLAGGFAGLLLFRSPTARWASFAFGAGVGIGSAYTQTQCSYPPPKRFDTPPPPPPPTTTTPNVLDSD